MRIIRIYEDKSSVLIKDFWSTWLKSGWRVTGAPRIWAPDKDAVPMARIYL